MGFKFLDLTVDTSALYTTEQRGRTGGIVGHAPGVTALEATLYRNRGDAETAYSTTSGLGRSMAAFFQNRGKQAWGVVHESTSETQRTFSGTGSKRDFELPYYPLPPLTVQADLGSGIQAVTEGTHYEVDWGNKTIWFEADYIPINGTDNILVDGYSVTPAQVEAALDQLLYEDCQLAGISYCFDPDVQEMLKDYLLTADSEGNFQFGYVNLPKGEADSGNVATHILSLRTELLACLAHNSLKDPASALLGVTSYYAPNVPMAFKEVLGLEQTSWFTNDQITTLTGDFRASTGLNVMTIDRVDRRSTTAVTGPGMTLSEDDSLRWIDTVRVIQEVKYGVTQELVSPRYIANPTAGYDKEGMQVQRNGLHRAFGIFAIEPRRYLQGYELRIHIEELIDKTDLTPAEQALLDTSILNRYLDWEAEVVYRGAPHSMSGVVRFVPTSA